MTVAEHYDVSHLPALIQGLAATVLRYRDGFEICTQIAESYCRIVCGSSAAGVKDENRISRLEDFDIDQGSFRVYVAVFDDGENCGCELSRTKCWTCVVGRGTSVGSIVCDGKWWLWNVAEIAHVRMNIDTVWNSLKYYGRGRRIRSM